MVQYYHSIAVNCALFLILSIIIQCSSFGRGFSSFKTKTHAHNHLTRCWSSKNIDDVVVNVDLADRSYPIYINEGLLKRSDLYSRHLKAKKALIVTNTVVGPLYAETVKSVLESMNVETNTIYLPDGEEYKTMETMLTIVDAALQYKLDRSSVFLALGGGVVGDMCGFAASIYQRGVPFIQLPTSLMAMVDSAVGGKTAVNHPAGKNLLGTFYQPHTVLIDTTTLQSLPPREYISGLSEVVKYGLIRDHSFFIWLTTHAHSLAQRSSPQLLAHLIEQSCLHKASIVALDEKEALGSAQGLRACLNLGHTFGHAIESGAGYGLWLHGEAVSVGLVMAALLSYRMGRMGGEQVWQLVSLLRALRLPTTLHDNEHVNGHFANPADYRRAVQSAFGGGRFRQFMALDKKVAHGSLHLVLFNAAPGSVSVTNQYDETMLNQVIDEFVADAVHWPW